MENENSKLLKFWDSDLGDYDPEAVKERWINEESFLNPINKYIKDDDSLLDYGCGSGWLSYELALIKPTLKILGVDPSSNAIAYNTKCAELSHFDKMKFICGTQDVLKDYQDNFDVAVSVNTLDVLPLDIIKDILKEVKASLKKDGYFLVCINPDFPMEFLSSVGYVTKGDYIYKDDILRGIIKTKEEWIDIFSEYFSFVEYNEFILMEREAKYPRRMFVLKNNI